MAGSRRLTPMVSRTGCCQRYACPRRQTPKQDRVLRINTERALNAAHSNKPPPF